jgi:hypothetical protein
MAHIITPILDWIARAYHWFYHIFLQRPESEPITRQASRIVQRWPAFCWGLALLILGVTAWLPVLVLWWLFLTIPVYLFAWWWMYHILEYSVAHKEDNPIYREGVTVKIEKWAGRRIDRRRVRKNRTVVDNVSTTHPKSIL